LIDEAARLIIKRFKKRRFGEMTNRLNMLPWKERLHLFNRMEYNSNTLASGSYQNIALTDDKRLLTWGAGKFGQLGNNIRDDQYHPQDITQCLPPHARIVQVSAGCGHTGILTDDGQVYVCGDNRYGQLSIAGLYGRTQNQHVLTPTLITDGLEGIHVSQIACGSSHTLFLSDSVS
jgi:alpha-tubulin suppressor-like RCC1 family protein